MTAISAAPAAARPFTGTAQQWDTFVRAQPNWSFCQLYAWKAIMEGVHGHECIYLATRGADGRLTGVLPLVRVKSLLFGHYLVSVPFLNYGGPLGEEADTQALVAAASELARRDGARLLELRSRTELPITLAASHRKVTSLLDLSAGDPDAMWKALPGDMRTKLRSTERRGVTVRFGLDQLEPFFQVFAQHMRELGTPTQPRRWFEAIVEAFPDLVRVGCAYHEGRAVAGGFGFAWDGEYEMTWASSLDAYRAMRVNAYLYWTFITRVTAEGNSTFNFGRSTPGSGTHEFKRRWRTRDEQLWWYGLGANGSEITTPSPQDAAYAWGPRLWKRLPTPLATVLGPRIVRYLP